MPDAVSRPLPLVIQDDQTDVGSYFVATPSFLSTTELQRLVTRLTAATRWDDAEEITFECEPGTLTASKSRSFAGWE